VEAESFEGGVGSAEPIAVCGLLGCDLNASEFRFDSGNGGRKERAGMRMRME
jgi:hypothetical protein